MKRFEELRDEQLALPPIVMELRARLGELRNVVTVGVGFKIRGGIMTDEIAWTVDVMKKLPPDRVARSQRIPSVLEGVAISAITHASVRRDAGGIGTNLDTRL
jgi:hypothetical protein